MLINNKIVRRYKTGRYTMRSLAKEFGISFQMVGLILKQTNNPEIVKVASQHKKTRFKNQRSKENDSRNRKIVRLYKARKSYTMKTLGEKFDLTPTYITMILNRNGEKVLSRRDRLKKWYKTIYEHSKEKKLTLKEMRKAFKKISVSMLYKIIRDQKKLQYQ